MHDLPRTWWIAMISLIVLTLLLIGWIWWRKRRPW
jgi:uncharacterized membrane protein YhfC